MNVWLILAAVLFILWITGNFVFHVAGGVIHILLIVIAVLVIVYLVQLVSGRSRL